MNSSSLPWLARLSPPGLPIIPFLDRIEAALDAAGALVLQAEPGAGKTTVAPPALLDARFLAGKRMVVLEPRRIATVAAAARIAELLGEPPGRTAGYTVRHERCVSRDTRIEIVTEGVLTRRVLNDPGLDGVGLVILDEFHERSVHTDLAFALLSEVRELRPDLRILVMSATLDAGRVADFLGCPVLVVPGRAHPVQTRYERPQGDHLQGIWTAVTRGVLQALEETAGDVLVFLAGAREMRRVRLELDLQEQDVPPGRAVGVVPVALVDDPNVVGPNPVE